MQILVNHNSISNDGRYNNITRMSLYLLNEHRDFGPITLAKGPTESDVNFKTVLRSNLRKDHVDTTFKITAYFSRTAQN